MKPKFFIVGIGLATLLCLASFLIILFSFDPFESGPSIIFLFYLSLFLSLNGIFGLVGFLFKKIFLRPSPPAAFFKSSLRQGALLALLLTGTLWLKNMGWLNWISGLILLVVIIFIEALCLRRRS